MRRKIRISLYGYVLSFIAIIMSIGVLYGWLTGHNVQQMKDIIMYVLGVLSGALLPERQDDKD